MSYTQPTMAELSQTNKGESMRLEMRGIVSLEPRKLVLDLVFYLCLCYLVTQLDKDIA